MASNDAPAGKELELLSAYLAERDAPCPTCGYNLRALTSGRCPECGDPLRLRVAPVEPRLAAYLALLAACCLALGGSTLFGLLALKEAPRGWWDDACAVCLLVQWVLAAALTPAVLWLRRPLRRARGGVQWLLAGAAWLLFLCLSAAVVLLFG